VMSALVMRYDHILYRNEETCDSLYSDFISDSMLCAGGGINDACQGDSGGLLFDIISGELVQVGIVSWGSDGSKEGYPGVYSDARAPKNG